GGDSWEVQEIPESTTTTVEVSCICFWDPLRGYATGVAGSFWTTEDGGNSWTVQETGTENNLNDACFIDDQFGWAVGDNGTVLRTTDGGMTWANLEVGSYSDDDLLSVHFTDALNGWVCGGELDLSGVILHTSNGGKDWAVQLFNQSFPGSVNTLFFLDSLHGWAGSNYGFFNWTNDGGETWEGNLALCVLGSYNIRDIYFQSQDIGWVASENGRIYYTEDGGVSFKEQFTHTGNNITCLGFTENGNGWAVGDSGVILSTENGGFPVPVEDPAPVIRQESSLSIQIYPNPVTSSTTIEYEIEQPATVSLTIYNQLGREVMNLTEGNQPAGTHQKNIYLADLPSGIYLCRLQVGNQSVVKRIVKL
ncbi:MAG: T9SS type A sorting domain-containing protein, partial [Bacteroidia bacterium]|nr:T9SS type A sorting domain-containing protein [Bacteroidia bacterium]